MLIIINSNTTLCMAPQSHAFLTTKYGISDDTLIIFGRHQTTISLLACALHKSDATCIFGYSPRLRRTIAQC